MCGLFGAIGRDIDVGSVRALAIINRERGTDSLGIFDSSGQLVKHAGDPADVLAREDVTEFLGHRERWFLAGHTRHATQGTVKRRNAHPFKYGNILGSHNGMVRAPKGYAVDSQYIFHRLNKCGGDYQRALENVSGYWSLTWFDGDALFVQTHDNTLWFTKIGGTFYYSSTKAHLQAAMGAVDCWSVQNHETYRFNPDGTCQQLPNIVVNAKGYFWKQGDDEDRWWSKTDSGWTSTRKTATGSITTYHSGKQSSLWRDEELATRGHGVVDRDLVEIQTRQAYEACACDMGFAGLRDLMQQMDLDSRSEAYDYIDQYYPGSIDKNLY